MSIEYEESVINNVYFDKSIKTWVVYRLPSKGNIIRKFSIKLFGNDESKQLATQ